MNNLLSVFFEHNPKAQVTFRRRRSGRIMATVRNGDAKFEGTHSHPEAAFRRAIDKSDLGPKSSYPRRPKTRPQETTHRPVGIQTR